MYREQTGVPLKHEYSLARTQAHSTGYPPWEVSKLCVYMDVQTIFFVEVILGILTRYAFTPPAPRYDCLPRKIFPFLNM